MNLADDVKMTVLLCSKSLILAMILEQNNRDPFLNLDLNKCHGHFSLIVQSLAEKDTINFLYYLSCEDV